MRPAKADFRSGTAVGRSRDAFGDHEGQSIEKPTVLLSFLKVAQNGLGGLGGGAGGGWGTSPAPLSCSGECAEHSNLEKVTKRRTDGRQQGRRKLAGDLEQKATNKL